MFATFEFEGASVPGIRKRGACTKCCLSKRKVGFNVGWELLIRPLKYVVSDESCSAIRNDQLAANVGSKECRASFSSSDLGAVSLSPMKSVPVKVRAFLNDFRN
jgi:hypothetical protein